MIKLTVDNQPILMPVDTKISIEKNSPVLNEEEGSFSYPFPVSTEKNSTVLGYPGRLERAKNIPVKSFRLEENGVHILSGEIEIDTVTAAETGMNLQSGNTEFTKRMKDKKLGDINYGGESWPTNEAALDSKLAYWDAANTTDNGKYVASSFLISPISGATPIVVNRQNKITEDYQPTILKMFVFSMLRVGNFSLQFRISFIIRKIYESAGYFIKEDSFLPSQFNSAILFGKIINVADHGTFIIPTLASLEYSTLMPDVKILDFINSVQSMFCLVFDLDEKKKEVHISFRKDIFLNESLDTTKITELTGWEHDEKRETKGFSLRYADQDNENDTKYDYEIGTEAFTTLPAVGVEGSTVRVIYGVSPAEYAAGDPYWFRDYIVEKNDADILEWIEIGRLKEFRDGEGENEIVIDVNVPAQQSYTWTSQIFECPFLPSVTYRIDSSFVPVPYLAISLYRGRIGVGPCLYPYTSFDKVLIYGTVDTGSSLKPAYLYESVYKEFINWKTYRARECTKYLKLSLIEVVQLQWRKRYVISGIPILLNQVSFEVPFTGIVKVNGFTA